MNYPPAHRADLVEKIHGYSVPDPYRWLEDRDSDETKAWMAAQDALWAEHRARISHKDALRRRLGELNVGWISPPVAIGHRQFFRRREQGEEFGVLLVREGDGSERVVVDPAELSADLTVTLDSWHPSLEGDRIGYKLSEGGDEECSLYVMDVTTKELIEGPIDRVRSGSVSWLPGGQSYYYVRYLAADDVPAGDEGLHRRMWLHRVGTDPDSDVLVFGEGRDKTTFYSADVSRDGRWLLVYASTSTSRNDLYIADLAGDGELRPVQEDVDAHAFGEVREDGLLYIITTVDAPRRRVVVTDPVTPTAEHWRELIPESDGLISDAVFTDDAIVLVHQRDVVSYVTAFDRATGRERHQVPLPGLGTATLTSRIDVGHDVWISYSDYFTPYEVWQHDVAAQTTELWGRPPGAVASDGLTTEQIFFQSKDGARVPMFIVHKTGAERNAATPTILYGYGGFNISLTPGHWPIIQAWVERGGVFALANIRGGSEYGEEWHRAGMRENKQNVFDDFIAAAEWLVDNKWTDPGRLAISGGSNGGLLVGAMLTQRPDLCRAVICSAPVLDTIRLQLFQLGGKVNTWEYGDADVPEEFEWLWSYSPYHHVLEGTRYPAVLFLQGEADTRVDPLHARKMCAALQWATSSDAPILLRREERVGHSVRSMSRQLDEQADELGWVADQLGLDLSPDEPALTATHT